MVHWLVTGKAFYQTSVICGSSIWELKDLWIIYLWIIIYGSSIPRCAGDHLFCGWEMLGIDLRGLDAEDTQPPISSCCRRIVDAIFAKRECNNENPIVTLLCRLSTNEANHVKLFSLDVLEQNCQLFAGGT